MPASAGNPSSSPASGARAHPVNTGGAAGISPNRANARSAPRSTGSANTGTTASAAPVPVSVTGAADIVAGQFCPALTSVPASRSTSICGSVRR